MLKKFFLLTLGLVGVAGAAQAQTFTLTIDAGQLRNAAGTAVATSGLVQLIASPSSTFAAPTSSSFVGGDNVLVSSFALNNKNGTGETGNLLSQIAFTTANYTVTAGESLLLRFYPTLTYSATQNYYTTAPALATNYGQVRSDTIEFKTGSFADPSETPWIVPAAGAAKDITYVTTSNYPVGGGTTAYPDGPNGTNDGVIINSFSTLVVGAAIPEPSTYVGGLLGCAVIAYAVSRRQRATAAGQI